jgi:hypothetical protein
MGPHAVPRGDGRPALPPCLQRRAVAGLVVVALVALGIAGKAPGEGCVATVTCMAKGAEIGRLKAQVWVGDDGPDMINISRWLAIDLAQWMRSDVLGP